MLFPCGLREFHSQPRSAPRQTGAARGCQSQASDLANANGMFNEPLFALDPLHNVYWRYSYPFGNSLTCSAPP